MSEKIKNETNAKTTFDERIKDAKNPQLKTILKRRKRAELN
jgi:hypothetical protein